MKTNGEGTLQAVKGKDGKQKTTIKNGKSCKVWRGRFSLGYDQLKKKYIWSSWRTFYGTKAEARRAMGQYRNEIERGISADAHTMTFNVWADNYCKERELKMAASPSTLAYEKNQVRILNLYLSNIKLKDITPAMVKQVFLDMAEDGYSPDAVKKALGILKRLLNEACSFDLIMRNPASAEKPPKVSKPEVKVLSSDRIAALMDKLQEYLDNDVIMTSDEMLLLNHKAYVLAIRLLLATGVRRGEALGLEWKHIDLEAPNIRVEQQQTPTGIRPPKSTAGWRTLSIDATTAALLKTWKLEQAAYLLKQGIGQNEETPVFSCSGEHVTVHSFNNWWESLREKNGFGDVNLHMFRHTHATLLIAAGVDIKTVQHRLGHENASVTLDTYSHFIKNKDSECADVMDDLFSKSTQNEKKVVNF